MQITTMRIPALPTMLDCRTAAAGRIVDDAASTHVERDPDHRPAGVAQEVGSSRTDDAEAR